MTEPSASRVFLVEHYVHLVDEQRVDEVTRRLQAAADGDVGFLGGAGLPSDECFLSLFTASGGEAVARAVERAAVVADRIVPVLWRAGRGL